MACPREEGSGAQRFKRSFNATTKAENQADEYNFKIEASIISNLVREIGFKILATLNREPRTFEP
jgi:hypothetical protein